MNLEGKNIVLTGSSSGIGLEILKLLMLYKNTRIIAVARNIDNIPQKKDSVYPLKADIGVKEDIDRLFEYAISELGSIDVFIANAGFAYMEKLTVPDWDHIRRIFSVNTMSPIYSLEKFAALDNSSEKCFVCVISAVAEVILPYYSLYCSTKSAIHHFLESYRYEARKGLYIAGVYPIATKTAFFEKAANGRNTEIPFLSQNATTVAKSILRGIEKNKNRIYPSFPYRLFRQTGRLFPFIFEIYSRREKNKTDKKSVLSQRT